MADTGLTRTGTVALLERHGLSPRKRLGQHFLVDPNIVARIVRLIESPAATPVVEVGAGTGALTVALRDAGHPVRAYEIDRRLEPMLREVVGERDQVEIRFEDATRARLDLEGRWVFVANLPYNVGTGILLDVLQNEGAVREVIVMVQQEVADRLVARPGSRTYGVPSVVAQLYCDVTKAFDVPPQVFLPPPNVGSSVVRLVRHSPPASSRRAASRLAAAAFGQRRKMLRSSLRGELPEVDDVLRAVGIEPSARAEQVEPAGYLALAEEAHNGG